ncbi:MAG: flavodoxin [Lachnospiraceae bacterium]|nr:flavodoxin [Lachnospiraceae bacterium]
MKNRKWIAALLTCALLVVGMTGCGASETESQTQDEVVSQTQDEVVSQTQESTDSQSDETQEEDNSDGTETTVSESKVLVVYYSASGMTEAVANTIAEAAGADVFEIVPEDIYTDDDLNWTDDDSRVSREYEDESLRDIPLVSTEVDNWDSYDTVFIGYPIWWGIAAWPTDTFVKANDFTGKTVIPFCTSASSGLGESGELLAEESGTGDWQTGMRFSSGVDDSEVVEWVEELGF